MTAQPHTPISDPHAAALHYAAHGLRVLPIRPGEKRPPMTSWQTAATTNPDTINAWWTGLYRDHGVGIATGSSSGIFVIDIDNGNNKNGDQTLTQLETQYGPLPETATVHTPNGGRHLYYQHPHGVTIRNDAGRKLGPHIDIRGEGGQCVAPGDGRYHWHTGQLTEIAQPPEWLIQLLTQPDPQQISDTIRTYLNHNTPETPAERYNQRTTWNELLEPDGWTLTRTLPDGEQHWTRPGKTPREGISATTNHNGIPILKIFTSSTQHPQDATYTKYQYYAETRHNNDHKQAYRTILNDPRYNPTPTTPTTTPQTPPEAELTATHQPDNQTQPPAPNLLELAHIIDWTKFWDNDHTDEDWIAQPIIPRGRAISLYAPAKAGKSTIVLAIAAAVATGTPILHTYPSTPTPTLYLDFEMTQADLHQRLAEMGYSQHDNLTNLHYALLPSLPPLDTYEGAVALKHIIDTTQTQLVIIDTFGRAVEGDEDSADTVRAFYRHTGLMLKTMGITYLRTDHTGKDTSKGQRGSSAKNDDVDLIWRLTRTTTQQGDSIRLERTHSRIPWIPPELTILREETIHGDIYKLDMNARTWPDGTRQNAELLKQHGITPDTSQREATRIMEGKLSRRRTIDALNMIQHTARHQHQQHAITTQQTRRSTQNQTGAPRATQTGGAPPQQSGAPGAPNGNKGSQGGALDTKSGAPKTSQGGAAPPFRVAQRTDHTTTPHPTPSQHPDIW